MTRTRIVATAFRRTRRHGMAHPDLPDTPCRSPHPSFYFSLRRLELHGHEAHRLARLDPEKDRLATGILSLLDAGFDIRCLGHLSALDLENVVAVLEALGRRIRGA